jgi:DNA-binding transcriptional ArsR family regulator
MVIVLRVRGVADGMSEQASHHPAADRDTKQARLDHPSGFLHLTRHESVPILIDAILDLPPGREFNRTELAEHAGVTRQTVSTHLDTLLDLDIVEPVPNTSPQRYRLAESQPVEELLAFNSALNAARPE